MNTEKINEQIKYAGLHLILEFWGVKNIDSFAQLKKILREAVRECGATLLKIELHKFSPQGVSGVAIVAESHISLHTWPEYQYAAFDVFMCGKANPYKAVEVFKKFFQPTKLDIIEIKRGVRL